jgi:hypothetical protein
MLLLYVEGDRKIAALKFPRHRPLFLLAKIGKKTAKHRKVDFFLEL